MLNYRLAQNTVKGEKVAEDQPDREITKEEVIDYLLKSPNVISVEFKEGYFHALTVKGLAIFSLEFAREKGLTGFA